MKRCAEFLLRQKGNMSTVILFWRFKSGRFVFIVLFVFFFPDVLHGIRSEGTCVAFRAGAVPSRAPGVQAPGCVAG